jgi:hypothetical protein
MTVASFHALELVLPVGRRRGTSVRALAARLGWSERKVRLGMQVLRRKKHLAIAGLPERNGVFIATHEDLAALIRTRYGLRSRALSLLATVRELDAVIAELEWSPTLFDEIAS